VVVLNDGSPDPAITTYLRELDAAHDDLVLLENERNRGFVATVNRGMQYDAQRDVLLLNSDVEVANDWLHRMHEAAYQHQRVASVTPFSNNATIFSFPDFCSDNPLLFGLSVAELDACFASQFSAEDVIPVPTGVGCCMYLPRDCLDVVGFFDEATFGRGYGEENDWCQRAERAGWRNLHLANCFVYHAGGVSFGAEQQERVDRAQQLLARKHPRYAGDVAQYLAADPAREKRGRVLLALVAASKLPKILMISHKLGGGAQQHVDELAQLYSGQALCLQLIPEREGESVLLTCYDGGRHLKDGLHFEVPGEYDKLVQLLSALGVGRVHFHHTMGLPPRVWLLARDLGCGYDLTVHDYYLVNGNPTLTDDSARYVSEQRDDFDQECAGHYPLPTGVDARQWPTIADGEREVLDRHRQVLGELGVDRRGADLDALGVDVELAGKTEQLHQRRAGRGERVTRLHARLGLHIDDEAVEVGAALDARGLDLVGDPQDGAVDRVDRDEPDRGVRLLVLSRRHVPASALDGELHLQRALVVERGNDEVGVVHLAAGRRRDVVGGHLTRALLA